MPPTTRRERGRITMAASELAQYDKAVKEVSKIGRDLEKDPPSVDDVVRVNYLKALIESRNEIVDDDGTGFTPDSPDALRVTGADALEGGE